MQAAGHFAQVQPEPDRNSQPYRFRGKAIWKSCLTLALLMAVSLPSSAASDTLRVAVGSQPEQFDPQQYRAGVDLYLISNVYERLLERNVAGELVPGLATKWQTAADGLATTFTLREGVKFHNGEAFSAEDVKFSFERVTGKDVKNPFASMSGGWKSIEVNSPTQVTFRFEKPNGAFVSMGGFAFIVSKDFVTKNGNEILKTKPNGTGPLQFVSRTIGTGYQLARFDAYWGTKAAYKSFDFKLIPDSNTRISALKAGQVDVAEGVPPQQMSALESDPKVSLAKATLGDNVYLRFNETSGTKPWGDARVRQALAYAIDQESIQKNVLNGLGTLIPGPSPLNAEYKGTPVKQYAYDPAKAKALLAQAGFANGFTMDLVTPANGRLPNSEQFAQAVAGFWSKVGVTANVKVLQYSQWADASAKKAFSGALVMIFGDTLAFDPEFRINNTLTCNGSYSAICDQALQADIAKLSAATEPAARNAAANAVWFRVHDQAYDIYGYSTVGAWATGKDVSWTPFFGVPYSKIYNAKPAP